MAAPAIQAFCEQHLRDLGDPSLITICATPNGISSYLLASDEDMTVKSVRHEQGAVVTRAESQRFGTLLAVLGGPAVVEIALHDDEAQRDAYRATVAAVDSENREHALAAIQVASTAIAQELGISVEETTEPDP